MANSPSPTPPTAILTMVLCAGLQIALLLMVCAASPVAVAAAHQCSCQPGFCCSKYGYCGTSSAYCGDGCQSGPCLGPGPAGGGPSVASVVTDAFFSGIKSRAWRGCEGQKFYTRGAFLTAVAAYPGFASAGSVLQRKREIAAFFAHVTHETGHMCYINEVDGERSSYCDETKEAQWPCYPGKRYFGRGALQVSWNYNYGAAGRSLGFDGLRDPDAVAQDPVLAFKTALWFWMRSVHPVMPQGFSATIRAINGADECHGGSTTAEMDARVRFYLNYCLLFGIDPGTNLYC